MEAAVIDYAAIAPTQADRHRAIVATGSVDALEFFDSCMEIPGFQKPGEDWRPWRALTAAAFGLEMSDYEFHLYQKHTGRRNPPTKQFREVNAVVGRRGGKGRWGSMTGTYLAAYRDYMPQLAPGERALIPIIAAKNDQAETIYRYIKAILHAPALRHLIKRTVDGDLVIDLYNNVTIQLTTASFKAVRSFTAVCALLDELAHFPTGTAANPDHEILKGLRPTMSTIPDAMILKLSAPDYEQGVLWTEYEEHRTRVLDGDEPDDLLVWKATSEEMHPGSPALQAEIVREIKKDPVAAACSYFAEFRGGGLNLVSSAVVEAITVKGREELKPCSFEPRVVGRPRLPRYTYHGFVDVSGGSADSFTLGVAHWDEAINKAVLDLVAEWPAPFKPAPITKECCDILKRYNLAAVTGDAYGGEWPREVFAENGIGYVVSDLSKHHVYKELLPALNTGAVELLDNERLSSQLKGLRRKVLPTGQERIDHAPGEHDDVVNAAAGALLAAYTVGMYLNPLEEEPRPRNTRDLFDAEVEKMKENAWRSEPKGGPDWLQSRYPDWEE